MDYGPTIVGVDPSLEALGFASIQPPSDFTPKDSPEYGKLRFECYTFGRKATKGERKATMKERHQRIDELVWNVQSAITSTCDDTPSLAVMEDFPHGTAGGAIFDRIGLYWKLWEMLDQLGIPIAMVNVAKLKQFATGIGSGPNAGKTQVTLATARRYPYVPITNDNEADAFNLAAMGSYGLGQIIEPIPLGHMVAFEATKAQPSFADQLREIGAVK